MGGHFVEGASRWLRGHSAVRLMRRGAEGEGPRLNGADAETSSARRAIETKGLHQRHRPCCSLCSARRMRCWAAWLVGRRS